MELGSPGPKDAEILVDLLIRAILISNSTYKPREGQGPMHCPVAIWEDGTFLDVEYHPDNIVKGEDGKRGTV